ncbi:hypothetical protein [Lysobacter sp. CA196]|uniref:hypothetical protein n=1 Tax=Lysobacter sp. CA196 TaxID=3455606 RepID=UPI003F8D6785
MTMESFQRNFHGQPLPKEFIWLYAFQQRMPAFAQGFALIEYDGRALKAWSGKDDFSRRLMPFASANRAGALLALWDEGLGKELDQMPVVALSEAAGMHVIAGGVLELMRILTYDIDIIVEFEGLGFYNDQEGYEVSAHGDAYTDWLKENFDADPVENPWEIVDIAQEAHGEAFEVWLQSQTEET